MNLCNCKPENFPFKCGRGSCPLKACRPKRFESQAELDALRSGECVKDVQPEKPKAEIVRLTPEQVPCVHRGDVLRQEGCGCSARHEKMDVFVCAVLGECTVNSPGKILRKSDKSGRVSVCIGCDKKA